MGWEAEPTYLAGHHLPLAKTLRAAPAQLLGPDLFSSLWSSLLIGPDLLQLDLVLTWLLFLSCFHFRSLLLILESEVAKLFPLPRSRQSDCIWALWTIGGTKVSIIGPLVQPHWSTAGPPHRILELRIRG